MLWLQVGRKEATKFLDFFFASEFVLIKLLPICVGEGEKMSNPIKAIIVWMKLIWEIWRAFLFTLLVIVRFDSIGKSRLFFLLACLKLLSSRPYLSHIHLWLRKLFRISLDFIHFYCELLFTLVNGQFVLLSVNLVRKWSLLFNSMFGVEAVLGPSHSLISDWNSLVVTSHMPVTS